LSIGRLKNIPEIDPFGNIETSYGNLPKGEDCWTYQEGRLYTNSRFNFRLRLRFGLKINRDSNKMVK